MFKEGYLEMEKLVNEVSQLKNKINETKKQLTVECYKYDISTDSGERKCGFRTRAA